jgi:exopolysaccharide biosynthesis polyprenyl glycosylphosphotransferase
MDVGATMTIAKDAERSVPVTADPSSHSPRTARRWERRVQRRTGVVDALAVSVAILVAYLVRFDTPELSNLQELRLNEQYALVSVVLLAGWLVALQVADARDLKLMGAGHQEYVRVSNATLAFFGAVAVVAYLLKYDLGRGYVAIALPLGLLLLNLGRFALRRVLVVERSAGRHMARALVVGGRASVDHLIEELRRNPGAGLRVVAACVPDGDRFSGDGLKDVPVVGSIDDTIAYVVSQDVDAVVVTGSDVLTPPVIKRLAWDLEPHGTDLVLAPALTDVAGPRIHTRPVAGLPLLHVEAPGYSGPQHVLKRTFDLVGASLLIVLFSVPLLVTAVAVKATSRGPVFFRQERIGVGGKPFTVLKFRSMVVDAESRLQDVLGRGKVGVFYKPKNDPRVTRVGRFIRRYSIDELPQLFNVLSGSMSLVGPRPQIRLEVEQYDAEIGRRLLVKPGMTGLWQVSGRNNLTLEESVRLDLYYVENWTMAQDLLILMKTLRAVVGHGAY